MQIGVSLYDLIQSSQDLLAWLDVKFVRQILVLCVTDVVIGVVIL